ncbi:hypothetical protein B0H13DRAFT_1854961 [Mycena leptocephala]|nr:hypothetical protein B0H13DRAFT_1854961 [Mycena leptocephala]
MNHTTNVELPITLISAALPQDESATNLRQQLLREAGRKDIHLAPEARIAARRKQALEAGGSRFAGMAEVTKDSEEEVNVVFERVEEGFAFMLELPDDDDDDEIVIDENYWQMQDSHEDNVRRDHATFLDALHISTARCNLISGSRIDKKGVSAGTGSGKIIYLNAVDVPFASGPHMRPPASS